MEKTKIVMIAKRVEGLTIGFIGVCFFGMGTSYFQEQLIYRMPRILVPIYDLPGSTALAVSMLVLGIALLVWGFSYWKSAAGKTSALWNTCDCGACGRRFFGQLQFQIV